MDLQALFDHYRHLSDDEIMRLSFDQDQLTDEARMALQSELATRRITLERIEKFRFEVKRFSRKLQRREALSRFKETRYKRWYGKADVAYDSDTRLERFTTTVFIHFFFFPLIPIGTFRVRKKRSFWSTPRPIEKLPLDWEQVLTVWVIAAAILFALILALRIYIHLSSH